MERDLCAVWHQQCFCGASEQTERLSVLTVSEQAAVTGPRMKQWLCRAFVGCLVGVFLVLFF